MLQSRSRVSALIVRNALFSSVSEVFGVGPLASQELPEHGQSGSLENLHRVGTGKNV
jgi:hypothetical protein